MSELCLAFKQKKLCQVSFATSELFFTNKFRSILNASKWKKTLFKKTVKNNKKKTEEGEWASVWDEAEAGTHK